MEAASEGEINKNVSQSPAEGSKRPKRQMKTPFQLEELEKTYAMETYPSEATRAVLSEKLGLTDRQLQMWFCHRRLKDKKEAAGTPAPNPRTAGSVGGKGLTESPREEFMTTGPRNGQSFGSGSGSASGSGSGSSQFDNEDDNRMVPERYYESPRTIMERRVIACVEAQLGEPLREDGPILGVEFDELPPGAFGAPIVPAEKQDRYRTSFDNKLHGQYDRKHMKASSSGHHEAVESKIQADAYGHIPPPYIYGSPVDGANPKTLALMHGNGQLPRQHVLENQVKSMDVYPQPQPISQIPSSRSTHFMTVAHNEDNLHMDRKRKSDEARIGKEAQAQEKKLRKELEKQDLLRRKREEQMKKEMERQERERQKEEQRMIREQQRLEEKFQREERREMERREKFMQKELLRAEKKKQKEERRREKEAARQKAAMERATARRIAKESMELIEDERLELMELAADSKGLPSIVSLDYDTLQNLESFRDALCEFPPKPVQLKMPFAFQPWIDSEENVGNLLMVWKFCVTFADILGLWPFTLDEFIQALHDSDSRLLGEIHIAVLKLIVKDIEDVVRTPSGGPGTNQYSAFNPEGGHPHIVEGAYLWGFDIRNWQKHLNPLTWPEILRQFALSAGFGPPLKKKGSDRVSPIDKEERGCEDIVSTLRNGSAAENAVAIMQEKGVSLQRRSRHRLTPGTVKFAAYHVLALEGSKGLNVIELAEKIQKSGLRDLTTSKTPEASISVALSRDPILFERIAPSTYCVRPAFRKDPTDAESVIAAAKDKIQRYANGFLAGQNVDEEERDDESDSDVADGTEVDALATPLNDDKNGEPNNVSSGLGNDKEKLPDDVDLPNGNCTMDNGNRNPVQGVEIDESRSGEPWVQGLTEGEYSDLSVEERLNALVTLIGIANEGNSIRLILEERMDAANSLKKQMWAEAQVDKRRMREEFITKYCDSSFIVVAEGGPSPPENKNCDQSTTILDKSPVVADDVRNIVDNPTQDASTGQFISPAHQNGNTTERSRLQLKSYIGQRAEELYVYRSLPLGQDRRRNRYWHFVASASCLDPGSGRIFVESTKGHWRLIDTEEAFDALLASLDTRGIRESHLHIMLQKIEGCFKECLRRNQLLPNVWDEHGKKDAQETGKVTYSPGVAVYSSNSDVWEPSHSFRIDVGRNEAEKNNLLKRYEDLQTWMSKQCFESSIIYTRAFEKKRCSTVLEICDFCLDTYDAKTDVCPSCNWIEGKVGAMGSENSLMDGAGTIMSNSSPLRVRLIKALVTLIEASIPVEALHSSWTDDCRKSWGLELQNSSIEGLLQILTQLEGAIKRDYLSADFETTEELLSHSDSSKGAANEFTHTGTVPQLPWVPKTSAATALRLFELDASIFYTSDQKSEFENEKKMEALPKFGLRYGYSKDIRKTEVLEFDRHGALKEENWESLHGAPGSSGYKQMPRARRPRGGRLPKLIKGSASKSGKRSTKPRESSSPIPSKQEAKTPGQNIGRGPRTIRKRRIEKKFIAEIPPGDLPDSSTFENVVGEPRISGRGSLDNFSPQNIPVENDDSSDSMEAGDSDDSLPPASDDNIPNENLSDYNAADENLYSYENWGAPRPQSYDAISIRSTDMMEVSEDGEDDEDGYDYEEGRNMEGDMESNDYNSNSNRDEGNPDEDESDSLASRDYSDD